MPTPVATKCLYVLIGMLATIASGCAAPSIDTAWPEPRPLGRDLQTYRPPAAPGQEEPTAPADPTGALSLRASLALALMKNPDLASSAWEVRAAEARALQAGLLPNPALSATVSDFAGTGALGGFDVASTEVQLSQVIELGGKRARRARTAALERDLTGWDVEAKRLDVLTETTRHFMDTLGAQEQVALNTELVRLAEQVLGTVSERVQAGKVSPIEETRSQVALSNTRILLEQAGSNLAAARKRLAAMWGQPEASFERVEGAFGTVAPIPSYEALSRFIANNPDVARWVKEMEQRTAALASERARAIPDLTISGGLTHYNDTDDHALVAGISIPLPLFDRNQGGIGEARARLAKAKAEARSAQARTVSALADAYQALSFAHAEARALKEEVLPSAEQAFEATGEGYREGKFDFLEFLDAQRTLFEARGRYIDTLTAYHKAVADVERLTGEPLHAALEQGT